MMGLLVKFSKILKEIFFLLRPVECDGGEPSVLLASKLLSAQPQKQPILYVSL
jgi:hypothetical protein